jgi:cytochrome c oxidase assembly factor 6
VNADFVCVVQVTYFKKRRVMEYQKEKTLQRLAAENAQELPPGVGPIPPSGPR